MILFLQACIDTDLKPTEDGRFDTGDPDTTDTETDTDVVTDTTPEDLCDGEDNDGDGQVDEGFPDDDGNGRADCLDLECPPLDLGAAASVAIREECEGAAVGTVADPWSADVEWRYTASGYGVATMPAIGNLDDDNGDGVIDALDSPEIVFATYDGYTIAAIRGDGSGELFEVSGTYAGLGGVAIADVDGNGAPDVVATTSTQQIVALDGTGAVLWTSDPFPALGEMAQCIVADLDNDGSAEVICDAAVVSGVDGSTVATLAGAGASYRTPVAADLDQDGEQEILLGTAVFDRTGTVLWHTARSTVASFAAIGDVDGDVGGEVFVVAEGALHIYDDDGTELVSTALPGGDYPGPPAIADFDGDGAIEIAIPDGDQLVLVETDGTIAWTAPMTDTSAMAGCSGYDFDADGAMEVVLADEVALRIYDGATGAVQFEDSRHTSGTLWEYPVIADVDGDGSAEVVVADNTGPHLGITVFGQVDDGWPPAGPTWATHDFAVTNVDPDGHVPSPPIAPWLSYDVFRARPAADDTARPDLAVSVQDACVADCTWGPVQVSVQVSNEGAADVPAGTPVAIYAEAGGTSELIGVGSLPAVPAGALLEGVQIDASVPTLTLYTLRAQVDDDGTGRGTVAECDEGDNGDSYNETYCP